MRDASANNVQAMKMLVEFPLVPLPKKCVTYEEGSNECYIKVMCNRVSISSTSEEVRDTHQMAAQKTTAGCFH